MILFGGSDNNGNYLNDLWEYNISSNSWVQLNPSGALPSVRSRHSAIYTDSNTMIVFGGYYSFNNFSAYIYIENSYNDLWKYDISTNFWIELNTSGILPIGRSDNSVIYTNTSTMIIYGGINRETSTILSDLWKYDILTNSWIELNAFGSLPDAFAGVRAIYTNYSIMVIYGGYNFGNSYNDVWEYDISTNSWALLNPNVYSLDYLYIPLPPSV